MLTGLPSAEMPPAASVIAPVPSFLKIWTSCADWFRTAASVSPSPSTSAGSTQMGLRSVAECGVVKVKVGSAAACAVPPPPARMTSAPPQMAALLTMVRFARIESPLTWDPRG